MRWLDRSFCRVLVCVGTAVCLHAFIRGASAGEAAAAGAPSALGRSVSADLFARRQVETPTDGPSKAQGSLQIVAPFEPELPPDDAGAPPPILAAPSEARPARDSAADRRPGEPRTGLAPGDGIAQGAQPSAGDVEAAVESMLAEKVEGRPIGARDWRGARLAIGAFYLMRGFAPIWTGQDGFTPAARAAMARLGRASDDGLDLSAVSIPDIGRIGGTAAGLARADVALSEAIVAYAVQASGGRIEPRSISPEITARPNVADPSVALAQVAGAANPDATLEGFNPPQKGYRDLREKLAALRAEDAPAAARIPPGPMLKIGMVDPRVAIIRARFGLDAIDEGQPPDALVYDAQVAAAVAGFQRANGLSPSGRLTPGTQEALSEGAAARQEAAVVANMEMWRWEPRDMGEERVEVNVPDFTLKVTQGNEVIHRARVIVGKPDTQTAIFSAQIKYLLINPAWNVPVSIIKKEMLPKLVNDPDYLTRAGFEVTQKGDTLVVRQPPGERNALGHLLFMFPNEHSIYLHDTPARGLFGASRRAFSHGCVRVDDPMSLGELVMGGADRGWTQARLRSLVGDKERTIFLPHPLPIHIEYFTAFVDDSGVLQIREDLYGHARKVENALGLTTRS